MRQAILPDQSGFAVVGVLGDYVIFDGYFGLVQLTRESLFNEFKGVSSFHNPTDRHRASDAREREKQRAPNEL